MPIDPVRISKFLSLVLRHEPEAIGLVIDAEGWTDVDDLIAKASAACMPITRNDLLTVVRTSDKRRFSLSADGRRIRAAQGHSIAVDLALPPREPPNVLFHGTATRFLAAILREGLEPRSRRHVHLSLDEATARRVGQRHGTPAILTVDAAAMHAAGLAFYLADNGVWLTERVPPQYLKTG
ncbi:MAG: RNA 2'-phosphotransferase [Bauldia sp.]